MHPAAPAESVLALLRGGRVAEAERLCRDLLARAPRTAQLHFLLGVILNQQGRSADALPCFGRALKLDPKLADAANARGAAFERLGRTRQAAEAYREALRIAARPEYAFNLGNALRRQDDAAGALQAYAAAHAGAPDQPAFLSAYLGMKHRLCDWAGLDTLTQRMVAMLGQGRVAVDPFRVLSLEAPEPVQQAAARQWARRFPMPAPLAPRAVAKPRLTVGYLSADLHDHATAHLMAEFFELHDRARFSPVAYSLGADDGSAMRSRLVAAFDRFVDCRGLDAGAVARRIAADGVDVLVDLKGYTRNALPAVMAARPAPVQVQWIGYPGTMGAPFVDYVIADAIVLPPESQACYDEAIVRLPHCYQTNDRHRPLPAEAPPRTALGLPADGPVLACFNDPYKLRPATFAVWMRLLAGAPGAVLWLYCPEAAAQDNLRRHAAAHGIDAARLVFAGRVPQAEHLARYRHVDVFLDTLPYNAHTTASDALWMGCPVVTLAGETFAGRVAASLLHATGLSAYVTRSPAEYEAVAARLLADPAERAAVREHLERNRAGLPLFDTPATTRAVERAYETMWRRAVAGLPPTPFTVDG